MFKKISGILALVGLCALSLFLVDCGSSSSRPTGLLYVLSQAESNVSSYAVDLGNGNLSLINANATTCTQAPCGLPLEISLDPTLATAFVLNQGSPAALVGPTIYSYTVKSDGSLSLSVPPAAATLAVGDTAVAMTRDAAGKFLFVITQNQGAPTLYVLAIQPGSTTVTLASSLTLTRVPTALSAITYTPQGGSSQTLLFMTSNLDLTQNHNDNELSVYSVDSSGNLTEQLNSPYTTQTNPTVVQAVNTNPPSQTTGGIFVYVGNQGATTGSVAGFQVCSAVGSGGPNLCTQQEVNANELLPLGTPTTVGQTPVAMQVDPTNTFIYIACNGTNNVYAFTVGTGTGKLTALNPATQPTGASPVALAMHASANTNSEFLYVSNNLSSSITGFTVGATTGTLSSPITVQFTPGEPSGMAGK